MLTENEIIKIAGSEASSPILADVDTNQSSKLESITIIKPQKFIYDINIKEFWDYRELLYFLILRDIKIRYKQTFLGILWVMLQPIITTVIFTMIFFRLGAEQEKGVPYPLFAFSGFIIWTFINSSITNCSNSLINHSNLITKIYFPRLIIPLSAAFATFLDLALGLLSLIVAVFIYGIGLTWQASLLPILIIPAVLLSVGIGILAAAFNVKYRDVKYILPYLLQVFFFISPVFYSLSMLPENTIWLWKLNPVTGILNNFRALLFNLDFDWLSFGISIGISIAAFFLSIYSFHRLEDDFADVI